MCNCLLSIDSCQLTTKHIFETYLEYLEYCILLNTCLKILFAKISSKYKLVSVQYFDDFIIIRTILFVYNSIILFNDKYNRDKKAFLVLLKYKIINNTIQNDVTDGTNFDCKITTCTAL